jgi:hypothetical protein
MTSIAIPQPRSTRDFRTDDLHRSWKLEQAEVEIRLSKISR